MTEDAYLLVDGDGMPNAVVNMDEIHAAGTRLAFDLAEVADDPPEFERIAEEALERHGDQAFGWIVAAALKVVVLKVLNPVLDVTDRLHENGALRHDLRAGLVDAARNAREAAR